MEHIFIGLYWSSRQETIKTAAEQLSRIFHELSTLDGRFGHLKYVAQKKIPNGEFDFSLPVAGNAARLAELVLETKRRDIKKYHPGVVPSVDFHENIGFVISFTASKIKKMHFSSCIGSYGDIVGNNFLQYFPSDFQYDYGFIYNLFTTLVRLLLPAYAVVSSNRFDRIIMQPPLPQVRMGWFNYFSDKLSSPDFDKRIRVEKLDHGTLTCITGEGETFSSDNPVHTENAKYLIDYFNRKKITFLFFIPLKI